MNNEIVVSEFWSEDKLKNAKVISSKVFYPGTFKVLMRDTNNDSDFFKFFKDLNSAEDEAENFVKDR